MASNTFQQGNQAAMWLHRLYIIIEALQCTFHIDLSETIMEKTTASYIASYKNVIAASSSNSGCLYHLGISQEHHIEDSESDTISY